jgi:nitrous oxide reductase accessory protein NosL
VGTAPTKSSSSLSAAARDGQRSNALTGIAALYALYAAVGPVERSPTVCPFRIATQRRCPLCGLTRATRALSRGQLRQAHALHPLVLPLWAVAASGLYAMRPASPALMTLINRQGDR